MESLHKDSPEVNFRHLTALSGTAGSRSYIPSRVEIRPESKTSANPGWVLLSTRIEDKARDEKQTWKSDRSKRQIGPLVETKKPLRVGIAEAELPENEPGRQKCSRVGHRHKRL